MSRSEVREIWQMGPLGYPFLYETQLPNFPNFHFWRRQWMCLTASAVSDRFTSYPTYIEKRAGQWLARRVRSGKKNVSRSINSPTTMGHLAKRENIEEA